MKERHGKIAVSTWLAPEDVQKIDDHLKAKSEELQADYPGVKISRHAFIQSIIIDWLKAHSS